MATLTADLTTCSHITEVTNAFDEVYKRLRQIDPSGIDRIPYQFTLTLDDAGSMSIFLDSGNNSDENTDITIVVGDVS